MRANGVALGRRSLAELVCFPLAAGLSATEAFAAPRSQSYYPPPQGEPATLATTRSALTISLWQTFRTRPLRPATARTAAPALLLVATPRSRSSRCPTRPFTQPRPRRRHPFPPARPTRRNSLLPSSSRRTTVQLHLAKSSSTRTRIRVPSSLRRPSKTSCLTSENCPPTSRPGSPSSLVQARRRCLHLHNASSNTSSRTTSGQRHTRLRRRRSRLSSRRPSRSSRWTGAEAAARRRPWLMVLPVARRE